MNTRPKLSTFGFTGHETFPFRIGWLNKGVTAVKEDSTIFSKDEAIVVFGIGKNMVRSIRHWCNALELIIPVERGHYKVTKMGEFLFDKNGADPYLENIGTLWWLHWRLARNASRCTTWFYVFNYINRPEFSKAALKNELKQTIKDSGGKIPSDRTLESDIECFIKTYTTSSKFISEESLECPLVELNILNEYERSIRLNRGEKESLPDHIFVASLIEYYKGLNTNAKTLLVERVLHGEGAPGRIFLLDENSCIQRLERLEKLTEGSIVYDSTAGMRQILFNSVPDEFQILQSYYQKGLKS